MSVNVMVNGLPGNMARKVAERVIKDDDLVIFPYALTGPEIAEKICSIDGAEIELIKPAERDEHIAHIRPDISVDFTHPSAVIGNVDFYCRHGLDFVLGTTGADQKLLEEMVMDSDIVAVIAPNMGKQIVAFQSMMDYAAKAFPGAFRGYSLEIVESHQKGKADTSGTAKAMVNYFNQLGIPFEKNQITMIREPESQLAMGVPEDALGGHAWHTYTLKSDDGTVMFQFTHNVNGREIYAKGAIDAIKYLDKKAAAGEKGKVYSMMDVLKGI